MSWALAFGGPGPGGGAMRCGGQRCGLPSGPPPATWSWRSPGHPGATTSNSSSWPVGRLANALGWAHPTPVRGPPLELGDRGPAAWYSSTPPTNKRLVPTRTTALSLPQNTTEAVPSHEGHPPKRALSFIGDDPGKLTGAVRPYRPQVGARGARDSQELRYRTSTGHWMPGAAANLGSVVSSDVADSISVRATYVAS